MIRSRKQTGYILLPVIVVITLVAAIALLMNTESALESNVTATELDAQQVQYVAGAGLNHALWQTAQQGCGPYTDITNWGLGNDQYTTSLTTDLGSTNSFTIDVDQDSWIRSDQPTVNNATDQKLHTRNETAGTERPLLRYDLSPIAAKATILSATAWFYLTDDHAEGPIDIYFTSADWTEIDATWDSMSSSMDSQVLATIPAQPVTGMWIPVNLTSAVQAWVNGQPNYGITLDSTVDGVHGQYNSRESANPPWLEVVVGMQPSSPALLKSVATLANGVTRVITRQDVVLYQHPSGMRLLQPDAADGKDAEIWDQSPNNNYGAAAETWVSSAASDTTRSLLQFNMGEIPIGAKILSANLSLERRSGSGADQPVSAHRILNPWSEDSVTWNRRQTGINWDTGGSDFESTAVTTTPVGPANQRYTWDITPLVLGWIDGSYPNYGVVLVAAVPGMAGERFYTSDDSDPATWPSLSISYSCACGVVCSAPQGSGRIVMVGNWPGPNPDPRDLEKESIIESWGYQVDQWDDNFIWSIDFNNYDLVYISETTSSGAVIGQLSWRSIAIVNEQGNLNADLGFSTNKNTTTGDSIDITDNSHFISLPFALGELPIYSAPMEILTAAGTRATELTVLGEAGGSESLMLLDVGAAGVNGPAPGRRVSLPLGRATNSNFNWAYLNNNGRLLVQRAIAWGMGDEKAAPTTTLLMVVVDPSSLAPQEEAKKTLIESWDYAVNLIDESDSQADFDAAVAVNDVVYITEDVASGSLNIKLVNAAIGVVTEEDNLSDEFGFSDSIHWGSGAALNIDNTHYITLPLALGNVTILTSSEPLADLTGSLAPDIHILGQSTGGPALAAIDAGDSLILGGTAMGRRVILPWGGNDFDVNNLNDDGLTILRRSLEWGAGAEIPGGFYLDEFPDFSCDGADEYRGSNGPLDWSGFAWTESGDDGRACGASLRVLDDPLIDDPTGNRGRLQNKDRAIERQVDLSSFTIARLSFEYRRDGMAGGAALTVEVSGDGGSNWATLDTIGAGTDAAYQSADYDISAYMAADTMIRFSSNSSFSGEAYIDNIRIDQSTGPEGPIAHWKLDEATGPTAVDSEGGHDGTWTNGPVAAAGVIDSGLQFDGGNDTVEVGSDESLDDLFVAGATISSWIYADGWGGGNFGRIADKADALGTNRNGWAFELYGANRAILFQFGFSGDIGNWNTPVDSIALGQWHHVVVTYDNGSASNDPIIYIDGVAQALTELDTPSGTASSDAASDLHLGNYAVNLSRAFDGTLDDVRIYNYVLSAAAIADLFTAGGGGAPTIFEVRVATGSDDAEERVSNGNVNNNSSDLELISDGGNNQLVGMRFTNVSIPNGATISSAYIQFQVDETNSGATSVNIQGQAIDDAPTFTTDSSNISSRSRTSATVPWSPVPWTTGGEAGPDQQTPNIATVIQEIISRPGWVSGNDLVIIMTGSGERTAESYNGDSSGAALLHIEY